jgi:hypothetical protein
MQWSGCPADLDHNRPGGIFVRAWKRRFLWGRRFCFIPEGISDRINRINRISRGRDLFQNDAKISGHWELPVMGNWDAAPTGQGYLFTKTRGGAGACPGLWAAALSGLEFVTHPSPLKSLVRGPCSGIASQRVIGLLFPCARLRLGLRA